MTLNFTDGEIYIFTPLLLKLRTLVVINVTYIKMSSIHRRCELFLHMLCRSALTTRVVLLLDTGAAVKTSCTPLINFKDHNL